VVPANSALLTKQQTFELLRSLKSVVDRVITLPADIVASSVNGIQSLLDALNLILSFDESIVQYVRSGMIVFHIK
jgi:hypothetical protein